MKDPIWLTFGIYGAIGFQLAASVVAGWLIGDYIDNRFGTTPWLALTGLVAGFSGGLYNLFRIIRWQQRNKGN